MYGWASFICPQFDWNEAGIARPFVATALSSAINGGSEGPSYF